MGAHSGRVSAPIRLCALPFPVAQHLSQRCVQAGLPAFWIIAFEMGNHVRIKPQSDLLLGRATLLASGAARRIRGQIRNPRRTRILTVIAFGLPRFECGGSVCHMRSKDRRKISLVGHFVHGDVPQDMFLKSSVLIPQPEDLRLVLHRVAKHQVEDA